MNAAGTIVLIIFLLAIAGGIGWIVFTRVRASQLGVSLLLPSAHLIIHSSEVKEKRLTNVISHSSHHHRCDPTSPSSSPPPRPTDPRNLHPAA